MKKTVPLWLLILTIGWAGFLQISAAQAPKPRVEIETARIQTVIRKLELSGTVTSPQVSQISTSVEGLVRSVHFDSGAYIKTGDPLIDLDDEIEVAALQQARAQSAQAAAEVADAERRLEIANSLAKKSFGPQNEVAERLAEIEIDQAALHSAKAREARQAAIVARHHLKAPFDGVISKKMVEVGQWVKPGTAVFELVAMQGFRIDLPVPQQYYSMLQHGAEVALTFEALPVTALPGKIDALIPVSDPDARTFTLRVTPKNNQLPIGPGMSASVLLSIDTGEKSVVVNRDALIRYPDGRVSVWVLRKDGDKTLVQERRIEIGISFDGLVQVHSGLKDGEQVVVRGNESLREGQAVQLAG